MFRPPPMRHGMPGHNPMGMRMPGSMMPRLRMPPGPPPGLPPRMMQHHNMHRPQQQVTESELYQNNPYQMHRCCHAINDNERILILEHDATATERYKGYDNNHSQTSNS